MTCESSFFFLLQSVSFFYSIANQSDCSPMSISNNRFEIKQGAQVHYSYSIEWRYDMDVQWHQRWDNYMLRVDTTVHYLSLMNSFVVLIALSSIVAFIILRILRAQIANVAGVDELDIAAGWKLVSGDVFRVPTRSYLLAPIIGNGVQMLVMMFVVLGKVKIQRLFLFFFIFLYELDTKKIVGLLYFYHCVSL